MANICWAARRVGKSEFIKNLAHREANRTQKPVLVHGRAGATIIQPVPRITPMMIVCKKCGAGIGEKCTRYRRTKRGKLKEYRGSPHPDRNYQAGIANMALNVLKPREITPSN